MKLISCLRWLSAICAALALIGPGWAGAPAPAPATGGPHTPPHQVANLGAFQFENGATIDELKVSFVTHGTLNAAKDNVILVLQHFTGDHHGQDILIGPGKALDPGNYFIIATDFLANARLRQDVTTGPTNSKTRMDFPKFTARDWVAVDHKLITEYLDIDRIRAAIGASIGATNTYQLAVSYPDFVRGIIPIAGAPVTNPQTKAVLRSVMNTITLDSGWHGGNYETTSSMGLNIALVQIAPWFYTYRWFAENLSTPQAYRGFEIFWRDLWRLHAPQDARDILYQLRGWADFNIGDTPGFNGNPRAALNSIKARALVIAITGDMLIRLDEKKFARDAISGATLLEIDSDFGHLASIGFDPAATATMDAAIAKFLAELQ